MKHLQGYIMVAAAACFWGASATLAKFLLNNRLDTLLLVQTRATFSAIVLGVVLAVTAPHLFKVRAADLWRFALLGIFGLAGANFTYYVTIRESSVATAITIQYTAPLFVMAYEVFANEEQFSGAKLTAAILSLAGCFLAVTGLDLGTMRISSLGIITGVGSIFTFAFLTIFIRHLLAQYSMWTVTFYYIACASMFWLVVAPPVGMVSLSGHNWTFLFVLAMVSVLIPNALYSAGLRYLVPSRAVITSTLEPVIAIVTASMVLGEVLSPVQSLGAALVIAAIILLQVRREKTEILDHPTVPTSVHGKN